MSEINIAILQLSRLCKVLLFPLYKLKPILLVAFPRSHSHSKMMRFKFQSQISLPYTDASYMAHGCIGAYSLNDMALVGRNLKTKSY